MESHYAINISQHGRHYFATAPHSFSGTPETRIASIVADLRKRFPTSEGFAVSVTYWQASGRTVTF